jgi:hypothetical protein
VVFNYKEKEKTGLTIKGDTISIRKGGFGLFGNSYKNLLCCLYSGVRGGGKCPEEEHTTCSGGPTINCHKRGLRGERK